MFHIYRKATGGRIYYLLTTKGVRHENTPHAWRDDDDAACWRSRDSAHKWAKAHISGKYLVEECEGAEACDGRHLEE